MAEVEAAAPAPKRRAKPLPAGIEKGKAGARLWRDVTVKYDLRFDELAILELACEMRDRIDELKAGLEAYPDVMVSGSQGQEVINPVYPELRQHQTSFAALMGKLKLPDDVPVAAKPAETPRSVGARHAANARWNNG